MKSTKLTNFMLASGLGVCVSSTSQGKPQNKCEKDRVFHQQIIAKVEKAQKTAEALANDVGEDFNKIHLLAQLEDILEPLNELKLIPIECREQLNISKNGQNFACGNAGC